LTKKANSVKISGRTAAIVGWLIKQADFLNAIQRGSLILNFAGKNISPQIKIHTENVSVDDTTNEVTISE